MKGKSREQYRGGRFMSEPRSLQVDRRKQSPTRMPGRDRRDAGVSFMVLQ